jgi:hypothetical protein
MQGYLVRPTTSNLFLVCQTNGLERSVPRACPLPCPPPGPGHRPKPDTK